MKEKNLYIFKDLEDAIRQLEIFGKQFKFPSNSNSKNEIVTKCVSSNIFRAFHLSGNKRPSELFRTWANIEFDSIIEEFKNLDNRDEFDKLINRKANTLINYWAKIVVEPPEFIIYGPAIKMVNLLVKHIQESKLYRQEILVKYQHIPFDKYSLKPLSTIINELTNIKYKISIPTNVSMKFVNCPEIYWILMNSIRKLSKDAKIAPIIYDYWSWDDKH